MFVHTVLSIWRTCHSLFLTKSTSPFQSHMATLTATEAHSPLKHKPFPLHLKWLTENICMPTYIPGSSRVCGHTAFSEDRGMRKATWAISPHRRLRGIMLQKLEKIKEGENCTKGVNKERIERTILSEEHSVLRNTTRKLDWANLSLSRGYCSIPGTKEEREHRRCKGCTWPPWYITNAILHCHVRCTSSGETNLAEDTVSTQVADSMDAIELICIWSTVTNEL